MAVEVKEREVAPVEVADLMYLQARPAWRVSRR